MLSFTFITGLQWPFRMLLTNFKKDIYRAKTTRLYFTPCWREDYMNTWWFHWTCFHMNFHLVLTRVPPCGSTLKRKTWWRTKQIMSAAQWTFHCDQFLACRSRIWFEHTGVLIPEKGLSFSSYLAKGQFFKTTSWLFGTTVWFTLPICLLI